jgi:hypothetical protein
MDQTTNGGIDPKKLVEQDLFEAIGMTDMTDEQKTAIMTDLAESVNSRVLIRIHDLLDEDSRKQWADLTNIGSEADMTKFLADRGISLEEITVEAALQLKAQFIEMANKLKTPN